MVKGFSQAIQDKIFLLLTMDYTKAYQNHHK